MNAYKNGMPSDLIPGTWVKSQKSEANGTCLEVLQLPDGRVAMRNSTDPAGPALIIQTAEMESFVDGAKKGEFDRFTVFN
ncbi:MULTISPECIES: DUF397 domain-containing protein [Streptomyces griseus group]|uniref:DUF397 domain-containing protein n=1 Tax=Streptomyces griseus group TaxID=629295 RepID=UPI00345FE8BB